MNKRKKESIRSEKSIISRARIAKMSSDSVSVLIGELVQTLARETVGRPSDSVLKRCKSEAFGILLGKRLTTIDNGDSALERKLIAEEPEQMLRCHLFHMQLRTQYQFQKRRCERFQQLLEDLEPGRSGEALLEKKEVLQFLLMLRDSVPDGWDKGEESGTLPGDMMPSLHIGPYPIFQTRDIYADTMSIDAHRNKKSSNPYCLKESRMVFTDNISSLLEKTENASKKEQKLPQIETSYFSDPMAELDSYQGPFRYNMMKGVEIEDDEQLLTSFEIIPAAENSNESKTVVAVSEPPREQIFNFNWENLGNRFVPVERPFASECNSVLHLKSLKATRFQKSVDIRIVRIDDFLHDVKFLITGFSSRCFEYDGNNLFRMKGNFTVDGISPLTINAVVDQFIELGTCFRRLHKMTKKNPYNYAMILEGFVFKAFSDCVERILSCFRVLVTAYEGKSLLQLQRKTDPMRMQILALAKFCGIHPNYESDKDFPMGSVFLDHLYKEIIYITSSDVSAFLLHILKHCCNAYFLLFQQWLFGGQLRDPSGELFIYFVDHYRPKTKHFFDKAFLIRRQAVPGFLKGFEEDILLCGKYTMLLKAFKKSHPIFSLKIPKLEVCLSYPAVDRLKARWLQYVNKARDACGPSLSVRELYEQKEREREEFLRQVEANFRRSMEQWRQHQDAEALELRKKKARQMEELLDQLNEIRESKLAAKKQQVELDLQYQQEGLVFENRRLMAENLQREKAVEGYKELNRMMDDKVEKAEREVERLKVQLAASGGDSSDFESCVGSVTEEDAGSVYEDAQKSPFSDKSEDRTVLENLKEITESDVLNSNDVISESEQNKRRVLGSNLGDYLAEDHANANVEAIKQTAVVGMRQMTEAQRNKMKIMTEEFGVREVGTIGTDLNSNTMEERHRNRQRILISDYTSRKDDEHTVKASTELTELQKNRIKIMSQEYNVVLDDHDRGSQKHKKPEMYLNLETDRSKNRRKILECEYDILTGAQNFVDTPMSVDSDTVSEDIQVPVIVIDDVPQDVNANPIVEMDGKLKLDTAAAQEKFNERRFGVPDTAVLAQQTPESGLISAGLQVRQSFEFPMVRESCSESEIRSETSYEDDEIYREFIEAMEKRNLNLCELPNVTSDLGNVSELKEIGSELRSLDVLTVTRFLQSSLVIPLKAHMEIVNSEILKMYLNDLDILGHFESLRNYFLLMDGEFSCYVCDNIFMMLEEVRSPDELLNYQTLHTILDSALCSSAAGADTNADRLSFSVELIPERFDLYHPNVVSMLNLSYRVEWPLNLILNPETIEQYTNIFKYLVKVRRVSFVLGKSFQLLKETHKQFGKQMLLSPQYSRVQLISHKLSHLVNALKNYITSSALLASWENFRKDLESAESMEDLYRKHTSYIKRILFLCLLNKKSVEFYNNVEEIFKVVLRFYKHLKSKPWKPQDRSNPSSPYVHPKYAQILDDESDFEKLIKYTIYLGNKMYDHGYQKEIYEFISVININGYYGPFDGQ
ncbi:gamma-tubulin complex component 6 [Armigeres subalbatus]|uniref:gamma-tubulin complex component 6 n=1 Tax=Armigeres subalbatus TaxID=124917 RepID=UPI002ED21640